MYITPPSPSLLTHFSSDRIKEKESKELKEKFEKEWTERMKASGVTLYPIKVR